MLESFGLLPHSHKRVAIGDRFDRLTVLAIGKTADKKPAYYAITACDCGHPPKRVTVSSLLLGTSRSCGCYAKDVNTTHGCCPKKGASPLYNVWHGIKHRCTNPKNSNYRWYGGRGITICPEWLNVANFIRDMEPTYRPGLELDRIDNDKGYSPDNCRWVTHRTNCKNTPTALLIEYNGEAKSLYEWSQSTGLSVTTIRARQRYGWSVEKTLTTPADPKRVRSGHIAALARKLRSLEAELAD
jgi:hypothetical protein